ncbi:MAG: GtrA family protein [Methylococcales bacterium]|nr:GtrA family protein [Methylococcales bacterium]MEE2766536.1 GtrA family protein [Pseudomonadota bacterium]
MIQDILQHPSIQWMRQHRFLKFGSVGLSGVLVNLTVLYLGQEYIFWMVDSVDTRLNFSLSLAIFCATISNFSLNRIWTWADRKEKIQRKYLLQLAQYFVACWIAIAIQFFLTKFLAAYWYYLLANLLAIVLSSVINFLVNDAWTFK